MPALALEITDIRATAVRFRANAMEIDLSDGRSLSVPLDWFPRLIAGTTRERLNWRPVGNGLGIHWPDLDEDISVAGLLAGRGSEESQQSIASWLDSRHPDKGTRRSRGKGHSGPKPRHRP